MPSWEQLRNNLVVSPRPTVVATPSNTPAINTQYPTQEWRRLFAQVSDNVTLSERPRVSASVARDIVNGTIDHTLLKLDATESQIDQLCAEAREGSFATVCVRPEFVHRAASNLIGSSVRVATVIGFHEGTYDLEYKMNETKRSLDAGAAELDVVLNYTSLIQGDYSSVYSELTTLRLQAPRPTLLKLILETSQLDRQQIIAACTLAAAAAFDFVKTSTGFCGQGATVENVRLMVACCEYLAVARGGEKMGVKASGGVRTLDDAVAMLRAGAVRLGASAGVAIAREAREGGGSTMEGKGESGLGEGDRDGY